MAEIKTGGHRHLGAKKEPVWWNWWSENPAEIILVIFILIFFFTLPRAGCGVTQVAELGPTAPVYQTGR